MPNFKQMQGERLPPLSYRELFPTIYFALGNALSEQPLLTMQKSSSALRTDQERGHHRTNSQAKTDNEDSMYIHLPVFEHKNADVARMICAISLGGSNIFPKSRRSDTIPVTRDTVTPFALLLLISHQSDCRHTAHLIKILLTTSLVFF